MDKIKYDWNKIQKYYDEGNSTIDVRNKFGCSFSSIEYAIKKGRFKRRNIINASLETIKKNKGNYYNWEEIQRFYDEGNSYIDINKKYGVNTGTIQNKIKAGIFKQRTLSESTSIMHKNKPESFKHSDETKEKLRKIRFEYLKKRTGKTAWEIRSRGEMSGLEKWFYDYIILKYKLQEKYDIIYNYPIYPYFTDFAFMNLKLDVELDGKYHLTPERQEHDKKKDEKLISEGWIVYRIPHNGNNDKSAEDFIKFLSELKENIKEYPPVVIKYEPKIFNRTYVKRGWPKDNIKLRRCVWPTPDELQRLSNEMSNVNIAKQYGVTEQAVRKWKKKYNI